MAFINLLVILGFVVSLGLSFKFPKIIYVLGLGALYLQILLLVLWSDLIYSSLTDLPSYFSVLSQINPGLVWGAITGIIPFPIPLAIAYLTGAITVNIKVGISSFFFFSIVQVILLGMFTKSVDKTEGIFKVITKYAIPIFSFLITVVNLFLPDKQKIMDPDLAGNLLMFVSICCCSTLIFGVLFILLFFMSKGKKH